MTFETMAATIRLGTALSAAAALLAVVLSAVGDVSTWSLVLSVALIGSIASWVQSGRTTRTPRRPAIVITDHRLRQTLG